ncbi:MAG: DegT/DnrJ/EryC1/StrS family aminotransferase [Clostridia bacterium]|nr:DegT/DnrJ/EryC1/StrS family aminotransferase [Clostridia bacterium]MBQ5596978.1 DegT/DnrJ/EryC1/StrS family aminotransferase [Clostridia bacterium]
MNKRDEFLPYCRPYFDDDELNRVADVLKSGWWTKGSVTREFEKVFAEYVGAKYAVAVNSCTAAMHIALVAKGIGEGDEVISTPMTFCSTINTIVHTGAKPVLVDIDSKTGLIDVDKIEAAITEKTKAIVPVHYAGQSCDMDKINAIAEKYGLFVLEDCAHALSTEYKGKKIGSMGNACAYSFYVTKNISTAEGGMLTTDDEELYEKASVLSLHGMSKNAWSRYGTKGDWKYEVCDPGFKYNLTDIAAALGIAQMNKLDEMQDIRTEYAEIYNKAFDKIDGITYLKDNGLGKNSAHLYVIQIDKNKFDIDRDTFIELLKEYNIGTSVHFIPICMHPYYINNFGYKKGDFPETEKMFEGIISLPLYPSMTREDVMYVIEAVREIAREHAK